MAQVTGDMRPPNRPVRARVFALLVDRRCVLAGLMVDSLEFERAAGVIRPPTAAPRGRDVEYGCHLLTRRWRQRGRVRRVRRRGRGRPRRWRSRSRWWHGRTIATVAWFESGVAARFRNRGARAIGLDRAARAAIAGCLAHEDPRLARVQGRASLGTRCQPFAERGGRRELKPSHVRVLQVGVVHDGLQPGRGLQLASHWQPHGHGAVRPRVPREGWECEQQQCEHRVAMCSRPDLCTVCLFVSRFATVYKVRNLKLHCRSCQGSGCIYRGRPILGALARSRARSTTRRVQHCQQAARTQAALRQAPGLCTRVLQPERLSGPGASFNLRSSPDAWSRPLGKGC